MADNWLDQFPAVPEEEVRVMNRRWALAEAAKPSSQVAEAYGVRNLYAAGQGIMGDLSSMTRRLLPGEQFGPTADEIQLITRGYRDVAAQRDTELTKAPIVSRGFRGVAESLPVMVATGGAGGPYAALGAAGVMEGNRALSEARESGLSEPEAIKYAVSQGVIEFGVGAIFQKVGLGGIENAFNKQLARQTARQGVTQALKQAGIATLQELPEELLTEVGHNVATALSGVDPKAINGDQLVQTIADTTFQTLVTAGLVETPQVGAAAATGIERAQRLAQLKEIRAKGYVSAEDGQTAGIQGETRKERLANTDAEIKTLEQEIQNAVPERETEAIPPREAPTPGEEVGPKVRVQDRQEVAPEVLAEPAKDDILRALMAAEAAAPQLELTPPQQPRQPGELPPEQVQEIIQKGVPPKKKIGRKELPPIEIGPEGTVVEPAPKKGRKLAAPEPKSSEAVAVPGKRQGRKDQAELGTLQSQAATLLVETRNFHPEDAKKYAAELGRGGVSGLKGFIADNQPEALKAMEQQAAEPMKLAAQYPYEMTIAEYKTRRGDNKEALSLHKREVRKAIASGKPVPPEVLADYPDLQAQAPSKSLGRKKPAAPPPELAQAGITIKGTPKGWSVTGIPQEIADGLKIDYQGKKAGKGYVFKLDPTAGLVDAARAIAAEAERDAAESAAGRVKTSLGYLERETAEALEQERSERLKVAKESLSERNAAVEQLLEQFVPKAERGKFKLKLQHAANTSDANSVKHFDEIVQYAKDHPELGLPQDETKLFRLLTSESFVQDDAALLDEIDKELAADLDDSFDFGANVPEPEVKQTAIAGTEEAVERAERREEVQRAKEQFREEAGAKRGKQKAFISGLGTDSPGQKTAFDVDVLDGGDDAGPTEAPTSPKPVSPPEAKATAHHVAEYGGKSVPIDYVAAKDEFKRSAQRVRDNLKTGEVGYVITPDGKRYEITTASKMAKLVEPKTKLQESADTATQEALDELDSFTKMLKGKGLAMNQFLDPEVIVGAGKVIAKFAKAGTLKFAAMIEHLVKSIGQAATDRIRPALESEWDRLQKSGDFSGMEPRTPEDEPAQPSGDDLTSIKKAVVNELREMVGLPETEGSTPQTVEQWAEAARGALAADPKAAIRLEHELAVNPRPISQHDAMLLQFRYRELANKLEPVVDEFFAAVKSKDPVSIATARTAVLDARKAMTQFEETIHPSKETWGRAGVALQQLLKKDFSLEAILRRGQEANHGEELSPEQTAELTALSQKFQDLQKQFEQERKRSESLEAELASKRQHEEAVNKAKREKVQRKSERRTKAEQKVADAWAEFKKAAGTTAPAGIPVHLLEPAINLAKAYVELGYVRFGEFMAAVRQNIKEPDETLFRKAWDQVASDEGVTVDAIDITDRAALTKAAREIQRHLVESGMTDRNLVINAVHQILQEELPDLTNRQTMDALSRYGQYQRQSQDEIEKLIRGMNTEILKLSQIDQMEIAMRRVEELRGQGKTDEVIGKALRDEKLLVEATGLVRDRPSQTVRQLTAKYNELKKGIPATPEGKAGLLQTALAQIERALKNRISDLRFEIEGGEKIVREQRERPTSEKVKALEAERDALVKIHKEMFPPKKLTEAQRISNALRASERAIALLEKQIESGDVGPREKKALSSPDLDLRRARLEQLRAQRDAIRAATMPELQAAQARKAYEASLRTRIADYQQVLSEGDFSPKPKKGPRVLVTSELKLKREMEDVRHEVLQKYADYHLAHLHGIAWGADKIAEAAHLSRAMMTSFDLSALLRQGGLTAMGHPILAKNALVETIGSIAQTFDREAIGKQFTLAGAEQFLTGIDSRQAEFSFMHKLTQGPLGEFRLRAGLDLPASDEKVTRQEEAFQGRWGKLVPGVAISSRLYTMILNKMRADLFDSMVHNLGRNGQVTIDEAKVIANFVNVSTGRANLGKFNGWAATLNTVFFAPRYVLSRFQYLAMPFYLPFQGGLKGNWRAKRAIYQEYGRTAAGIGTVLGLFALIGKLLWDDDDPNRPRVGLNPISSDFLKVRIGETRLDFLAGLSQVMVLSSRQALGRTTSSVTGETRKFGEGYNPPTRLSVLGQFARTKLAPVPGVMATMFNDWTNVVGQQETPLSLAVSAVSPLSLRDVATTMQAQGIPKGSAMSLLSILGVGMNTYGPKTQYMTGTPEERQAQIKNDLKTLTWDSPDPAYSEFLTEEQLGLFEEKRREKRGLVVYNATYTGDNEDELKTREKNRAALEAMGVSFEESVELLKAYYRLPDEKGKKGNLTEGYYKKKAALKRMFE